MCMHTNMFMLCMFQGGQGFLCDCDGEADVCERFWKTLVQVSQ